LSQKVQSLVVILQQEKEDGNDQWRTVEHKREEGQGDRVAKLSEGES
jgi:hypothetical protein